MYVEAWGIAIRCPGHMAVECADMVFGVPGSNPQVWGCPCHALQCNVWSKLATCRKRITRGPLRGQMQYMTCIFSLQKLGIRSAHGWGLAWVQSGLVSMGLGLKSAQGKMRYFGTRGGWPDRYLGAA